MLKANSDWKLIFGRIFTNSIVAFLLATVAVFAIRFTVCSLENGRMKAHTGVDFAPFQLESAIAWARANKLAAGEAPDSILANSGQMSAEAQLAGGVEDFAAFCIKLRRIFTEDTPTMWEDNPSEAAFVQLMLALWISLGGGIIWLWMKWEGFQPRWCWLAVLFFAIVPSALMRYTGQDLLKGAFAMNFVLLTMAFEAIIRNSQSNKNIPAAAGAFTAALAAGCFWDMSQILFALWSVCRGVSMLFRKSGHKESRLFLFIIWAALLLAAVITPYGRTHGSLVSPAVTVILPWAILCTFCSGRKLLAAAALPVLAACWWLLMRTGLAGFAANYGHFGELLAAKIKFLNIKPEDASLLSFNQRILWTPELQSADWHTVITFFPAALPAAFLATLWLGRKKGVPWRPMLVTYAVLTCLFFITFIFMVRFHEMAAVFLVPWCVYCVEKGFEHLHNKILKTLWVVLWIILIPFAEGVKSFNHRIYSPGLPALADTVAAARAADISGKVVIADFELGCLLTGYAGSKIAIQPKFELESVRNTTEKYINTLYCGTIEEMADFCEEQNADYIFLRTGQSREPWHIYGYRYMANARTIPAAAPVKILENIQNRENTTMRFRRAFFTDQHLLAAQGVQIFRFSGSRANFEAWEHIMLASAACDRGDIKEAIVQARDAYAADPVEPVTEDLLEYLTNMKWDQLLFVAL